MKILVINLGWEQQPLITALKSAGHSLHGIHCTAPEHPENFESVRILDLRDLGGIRAHARALRPEAVVSDQCDYSMFAHAVVSEDLGLPGPRVAQAQLACNKWLQRDRSREAGLDIPAYACVTCLAEARSKAETIGYPVILKPVDNRGSFGVNKVDDPGTLAEAYYDALANSHSRYVLVEEFIHGVHITVDGYAFRGLGCKSLTLATKGMLGGGRQVAMDILYPGELAPAVFEKALRVNEEVNTALGYAFGMTHSEYMVTEEGRVVLIESANRGGGCFTSEIIVPATSGVNVLAQLVDDVTGTQSPDRYEEPAHAGVLLKFFRFQPGLIRSFSGLDEVRSSDGVLALRLAVAAGQRIDPITTDANRHGFLILKHDIRNIRQRANELIQLLEVHYE